MYIKERERERETLSLFCSCFRVKANAAFQVKRNRRGEISSAATVEIIMIAGLEQIFLTFCW